MICVLRFFFFGNLDTFGYGLFRDLTKIFGFCSLMFEAYVTNIGYYFL